MPQVELIRPLELTPTGGSELAITNRGSQNALYGTDSKVSPTNKTGTLNPGETLTVTTGIVWFVAEATPVILDLKETPLLAQPLGSAVLGTDGTIGGPGGSPVSSTIGGGISGTTPGGGAQKASYGRTSTIAAPVLRDVVSILDFAGSTNGNGTTDDGAIFRAAVAAIKAVGGGMLIVTPQNLKGELATWHIGINETSGKKVGVELCSNLTISAYGARFTPKAPVGAQKALFGNEITGGEEGVLQATDIRFYGGTFEGTGAETQNQNVIQAYRLADVTVRDMKVTNWGRTGGAGVYTFSDCHRMKVESCTITGCCKLGALNAINFFSTTFGTTATPYSEIIITNNIVVGGGAAPICVQVGRESTYVNTVPTRVVISNNVVESLDWDVIIVELGGKKAPEIPTVTLEQITISNNIVTMNGPTSGSNYAIYVVNDSEERLTNPNAAADIQIAHNTCTSTWNGIGAQGTRVMILDNDVTAVNTGIVCENIGGTTTAAATHMHVKGGIVRMKGEGKGSGVWFKHVNDSSIDGVDVIFEEQVEREDRGVLIDKCERIDVQAKVTRAPRQGILVKESSGVHVLPGTRVYNPSDETTGFAPTGTTAIGASLINLTGAKAKGFVNTRRISFSKLTEGVTGLAVGVSYFLVGEATNGFELAATEGGAAIKVEGHALEAATSTILFHTHGSGIEGISLTGSLYVEGAHVTDSEGNMQYAINNETPGVNGRVYSRNNTLKGWSSAAYHGTITTQSGDITDETGAIVSGQRREFWGTAHPEAEGVKYAVGDKCWNTNPTTKTSTALWMCYEAGEGAAAKWAELKLA